MLQLGWSVWHKEDRGLLRLLHTKLHWLDVPERVTYQLGIMMYSCLHTQQPLYLPLTSHDGDVSDPLVNDC